ncbi:MAG: type III-A CRISPR-associated RAMP protein Csm5 [Haliscomenobacteraceae bacterium CHB4]|nr:type III-A CRISPR-associated RAMP protein Csm5 [Haliscomenobacteraceae bacterium CHB4]
MNTIQLETLTPVHIGSGASYEPNRDFLYFDDERTVAMLLPERILEVISGGNRPQAEDISKWVSAIDRRESILPFLRQRKPNLQASEVARRVLNVVGTPPASDKPMREQIHAGNGQPYIPGSSLKGSIRTALLDRLIKADDGAFVKKRNNLIQHKRNRDGSTREEFLGKKIEEHYFGKDPNHDVMRLLQVGDAYFSEKTTCLLTTVINGKRGGEWDFKTSINQFVEAIPGGVKTDIKLIFNEKMLDAAQKHRVRAKKKEDPNYKIFEGRQTLLGMLPLHSFFQSINNHTAALIESEIKYWDEEQGNPEPLGDYLEHLRDILQKIDSASPNECFLRLGWGTGFLNMTGDWQYYFMNERDYDDLIYDMRDGKYADMVFPKTRRLIEGGMPLGYVKLSLK